MRRSLAQSGAIWRDRPIVCHRDGWGSGHEIRSTHSTRHLRLKLACINLVWINLCINFDQSLNRIAYLE